MIIKLKLNSLLHSFSWTSGFVEIDEVGLLLLLLLLDFEAHDRRGVYLLDAEDVLGFTNAFPAATKAAEVVPISLAVGALVEGSSTRAGEADLGEERWYFLIENL